MVTNNISSDSAQKSELKFQGRDERSFEKFGLAGPQNFNKKFVEKFQ